MALARAILLPGSVLPAELAYPALVAAVGGDADLRPKELDAGTLNFGATAHWPTVSRLVSNLWLHLGGEPPPATP